MKQFAGFILHPTPLGWASKEMRRAEALCPVVGRAEHNQLSDVSVE